MFKFLRSFTSLVLVYLADCCISATLHGSALRSAARGVIFVFIYIWYLYISLSHWTDCGMRSFLWLVPVVRMFYLLIDLRFSSFNLDTFEIHLKHIYEVAAYSKWGTHF